MSNIKLGITLYSFRKEFINGEYSLEDCIRKVAELGCEGYEIVATQMFPEYPYVSDQFVGKLKRLSIDYGVKLVAISGNMDRGKRRDRNLTEDEMLKNVIQDLQNASLLECPVMKSQFLISPEVMKRAAPYAEQYGVKLAIEIHNPEIPTSPIMQKYYDAYVESGSKYIGFVPDFGCFAVKPNKPNWDLALKQGGKPELLEFAAQCKYDEVPRDEARMQLIAKGATDAELTAFESMYGYLRFTRNPDFDGLRKIMPYCFHFHGKFHAFDEDGNEASIPYDQILDVIYNSDYDGYIVSEYEGRETPALPFVKQHIQLERRIIESLKK